MIMGHPDFAIHQRCYPNFPNLLRGVPRFCPGNPICLEFSFGNRVFESDFAEQYKFSVISKKE